MSLFITKSKIVWLFWVMTATLFAEPNLKLEFAQHKPNTGLITISMFNESNKTIRILTWNTPFEKTISADIFHILHEGKRVEYIGRMVKRLYPKNTDYITLKAGEKHNVTVDIAQYYRLEHKGKYFMSYKGSIKSASSGNRDIVLKNTIPSIEFTYIPTLSQNKMQKKSSIDAKVTPGFHECSENQITILNSAHDEAILMAQNAVNAMSIASYSTSADRYRIWFGAADSARQNIIQTHFNNIYQALDTKNVAFDCSCTESYFAYVQRHSPYTIYLCNGFWYAELVGSNSMAGTLIHEMSHFAVVANTRDHAYTSAGARTLAIEEPNRAIYNADNHEYFAENTPFLSMENTLESEAQVVNFSQELPLSSEISTAGGKDIYRFTAEQGGMYKFYTTGSLDTYGILVNGSYVPLKGDDDSAEGFNFSVSHYIQAGETFYVEIDAYGNETGAYILYGDFVLDTDGDGIGDNTDSDDDNDGVPDNNDAFPLDANESIDTDGDGIGDNADRDDDNDGIPDTTEIANGTNPLVADNSNAITMVPVMMGDIIIFVPYHK